MRSRKPFLPRLDSHCSPSSLTQGKVVRSCFWVFCRAQFSTPAAAAAQSSPHSMRACPVPGATPCWNSLRRIFDRCHQRVTCQSPVEMDKKSWKHQILISGHRSHFGSRYTLGCCGRASLFCAGSIPAAFTLLRQQGKLCAVASGLFAELHFCRLPPWLPNSAQSSSQHAQ